jgi:probable rRNA maturation factor
VPDDRSVEIADETGTLEARVVALLDRAARVALEAEAAPDDAEISVTLLDDEGITRVNTEFLSHEGPADVISFPLRQPGLPLVGDIYIGLEQARRQAEDYGVSAEEELVRLVVHGILHVLGWEHPEGEERMDSAMYRRQEELVRLALS